MEYSHPEVLVSTEWVAAHLDDPQVRILEVDYEPQDAYQLGHIPQASLIDWKRDINDPVRRDILCKDQMESLMSRLGVTPETTLALYGDLRNWFAAFAFWTFKIYGHKDVRLMNGGRGAWYDEGRDLTEKVPEFRPTTYKARGADLGMRVLLPQVLQVYDRDDFALVDVRSPAEYNGEISAPPEYPNESCQRAGHIPGAANVPWSQAIADDDTFRCREELETLYTANGITPDKSIVTYCRIGERSSHTWFVLKYLLGYPVVINYDGSWSEFGNAVGVPVENPSARNGWLPGGAPRRPDY